MQSEANLKRSEFVNGRQPEFDSLCKDVFDSLKDESTRNINLKPSSRFTDIYNVLCQYFGFEGVSYLDKDRKMHGQDISINQMAIPDIVVFPERIAQIQWLCSFASNHKIPLIPFGRGSSLQSNAVAPLGGITIDMSKMSGVLEFNPDDQEIRVETGMTKNALSDYLKGSNLFLPVDIGCDATIGGLIATNASGASSFYYGTMRSHVISMKVVMPDGNVIITGNRAKKHSIGYDLNSLFIGAEGTLGIVVEVVLKLQPVPKAISAAYASFENPEDAINCATKLIRQGLLLQRCEFLDKQVIQAINKFHNTSFPLRNYIFIESHGNTRNAVDFSIDECKDIFREGGVHEFVQFSPEDNSEIPMLWKARSTAWMSIAHSGKGIQLAVVDVAVPLSKLNEAIQGAKRDFELLNVKYSPIIAHIGDGSFYSIVPTHYNDRSAVHEIEIVCSRISQRAIQMEGTCSASNGIGMAKRELLEAELGKETIKIMRGLKSCLDPNNVMNPGKVFMSFEHKHH